MRQTTLAELAERFDHFLLDQFGVLLDGTAAYVGANDALRFLAERNKKVIVLTNSGKRSRPNEERLVKMGFDRADFCSAVSSGEAARTLLTKEIGNTIRPGAPVLILSRDGDTSCIEGLDLTPADDPTCAELVLISGSRGEQKSLDDYSAQLADPAARSVRCFCTNPDMTMLTKAGPAFGAGRIAALYTKLGGEVSYVGKPHPLIYKVAIEALGNPNPAQVVCIGDSPAHDIRGAHGAGCKAALVRTGIHAEEDLDELLARVPDSDKPDFVIPGFSI